MFTFYVIHENHCIVVQCKISKFSLCVTSQNCGSL